MSEYTTHTPQIKRLERASSGKILAGVSAGLGRYFDLSPTVFRLGFVVLTLLGGAGILVYLAAVLVMPAEGQEQSVAAQALAERRDRPWPLIGLGLAAVALIVLISRADSWPAAGGGWVLILLFGLVILWSSRRERRARRVLLAVTGLAAAFVTAIIVAIAIAFASFNVSFSDGVGDRAYTPTTLSQVKPDYKLGIGKLDVDLSGLAPGTTTHVEARVGVGRLRIVVPKNAAVSVNAHATVGEVHNLGSTRSGHDVDVRSGTGNLVIDAKVGAGRVDIVRGQ
jgi:phage shock protein PspC (stress-responsive transcriptional regulator)